MEPIKTLIVDDNVEFRELAIRFVKQYFKQLFIIDGLGSVESAKVAIVRTQPDLLILDVKLLDGTAFDLLDAVPKKFYLLFTSGYEKYAVEAFKYSPCDYLLKPFNTQDLSRALQKACAYIENERGARRAKAARNQNSAVSKIWIRETDSFISMEVKNIIRCLHVDETTTKLIGSNNEVYIAPKSLNDYERILHFSGFCRILKNCLINVNHIVRYHGGNNQYIELTDGEKIEVKSKDKEMLLKHFVKF